MSHELFYYTVRGDAPEVARLLDGGADPNAAIRTVWDGVVKVVRE